MANGSPDVRAVANWVAPSLAEDGVAAAIEKFVLPIDGTQFVRQFQAAEGWLGLGDYASATHELDSLPAGLQQNPMVLQLRWDIFSTGKDWENALGVATTLTSLDPNEKHAWISRSFALHELKRTAEARENLLAVLDRFPKFALMRYNLACYECQLGDLDAACEHLRETFALPGGKQFRSTGMLDPDLAPLRDRIPDL
jgi:predicted Zn-dependent protease